MSGEDRYEDALRRGALVNLLGLAAKLVFPLYFVLATWMFGPSVVGLFLLASFVLEVGISAVSSGFNDAVIVYGSHHSDRDEDADHLYRILGNGVGVPLAAGLLLMAAMLLGAEPFCDAVYPDRPTLPGLLKVGALSLPLIALSQIAIAATKAKMHMEYDALINGLVKPFALLGFSVVAWLLGADALGLMWAHTATWVLLTGLALRGFGRHFDVRRTVAATLRFRPDRQVLEFAVPQSLNMTFNRYLTRLDVMMLAYFGYGDERVAFYATGALLTSHIREVKLIFSQALAPVAARHHGAGATAEFEAVLGRVSRWTTTLAVPLLLLALVLRDDLLVLVDPSYVGDTVFMAVLLLPPFLSCAFGLAGNSIVFTGHSRWNLLNSLLVAGLNTVFNLWLIPLYGLLGAALATALAASLVATLQIVELRFLEGIQLRLSAVWKPHLGLAGAVALLLALWDPAAIGRPGGLLTRIGLVLALWVGFAVLMLLLGHPEARALARRLARRRSA